MRFSLTRALGLSVLAHVLLALLLAWSPVGLRTVAALDSEEDRITFTFASRPDAVEQDRPAEDLPPPPTEPQPAAEPAFEPPGDAPSEPLPAPTPATESLEPAVDEPDAERNEPLPEFDAPGPSPDDRRLDVRRALEEFRRTMVRRAPSQQPSQGGSTPRNVFVPDLSAVPQSGFGMGNLVFESTDYDWNDYGRQIYMAIWRAWHNRLWMTTDDFEKWAHRSGRPHLEDQMRVRFAIQANGQVTGVAIEAASDCPPLDASAADALAEVILPPLPSDFPRTEEVVHARFLARGEVLLLCPVLGRYKRMGLF